MVENKTLSIPYQRRGGKVLTLRCTIAINMNKYNEAISHTLFPMSLKRMWLQLQIAGRNKWTDGGMGTMVTSACSYYNILLNITVQYKLRWKLITLCFILLFEIRIKIFLWSILNHILIHNSMSLYKHTWTYMKNNVWDIVDQRISIS